MSIQAFLKENVKKVETTEVVLDRFSEPITLKVLNGREMRNLYKKAQVKGKLDEVKLGDLMAVASIVSPDLSNAELQESYGVVGELDLYNEMFTYSEQAILQQGLAEASEMDLITDGDINAVKN